MYGLPPDFDPAIFIGRELQQVSFTVNTVRLAFDDDIAITLDSAFIFQIDSAAAAVEQAPPVQASNLMALVGRQVCSARSVSARNLLLEFAAGGTLTCIDDSKEYESFHIWIRGKEIVV